MLTGIIVNSLSILIGGLIGTFLGDKLNKKLKEALPPLFGIASMGMGLTSIIKIKTLPAVILAFIIGSSIGILVNMEGFVGKVAINANRIFVKKLNNNITSENQKEFMQRFVTLIVLFCASSTGIYGSLVEGMTGDSSILLTKSILDLFTSAIFASSMGYLVATIAFPQFIIFSLLSICSRFIIPFISAEMLADFSACGGLILLATGFRISGIKEYPTADMIPALILVMPISYLWTSFIL